MKGEDGGRKAEGGGRKAEGDFPFPPSALRPPLSILLLGDADRAEFRDARPCLERWGTVHAPTDVATAAALLVEGEVVPDVIVVAQAFPGQFSHQAIDHLRRLAPLARVVGLMGSWCEGEMRSGTPWPAAVRTYWHQWAARCNRQLQHLANGECCSWTLPPTATEEERLLADTAERWPRRQVGVARVGVAVELPPQRGLVLIRSRSQEMAEWLSAACRSLGFATVWQRPAATSRVEGAMAAIFDAAELSQDQCDDIERLAAALHPAPVIALLAFPRVDDHRRALLAGAASVLSKPLAADDLFWELERVASG